MYSESCMLISVYEGPQRLSAVAQLLCVLKKDEGRAQIAQYQSLLPH
jgi:hypothetical protein